MKKYISPSINANYFRECILDYLTEVHHYPKSELTFWTFVDSPESVKFKSYYIAERQISTVV